MTVERHPHIQYEVDAEELVQLLARPEQKDPRLIRDPVALYGTKPLTPDAISRAPMPGGIIFGG